jgi:hypothetical protein
MTVLVLVKATEIYGPHDDDYGIADSYVLADE